jgi:antirestriction protein ArdC
MQRPDATRVAGYHTWKSVGRQVRKGEHGIAILAPIVPRLPVAREDEDGTERVLVGHPTAFGLARVFDIAQTDGEALPEVVSRLIGDDAGSRFAGLAKVAATLGYSVEVSELPGQRNGDCTFELKRIRVREGLEPAQSVKTLAHELAHAILHSEADCTGQTRAVAELEAESVAFVVCDDLGLDSSAYSFGYIATWAGCGDDADKAISASAQRINKAARTILEVLEGGT